MLILGFSICKGLCEKGNKNKHLILITKCVILL